MSSQCRFGTRADAIQNGFVSRRYKSLSDRDAAIAAHLKRQWDALTPEQRKLKLPIGVRQAT